MWTVIQEKASEINAAMMYERDFGYDYFWLQDAGEELLVAFERKHCGAPTTLVDARIVRDTLWRRDEGNSDLQFDVAEEVHTCNTNSFQCRHSKTTDVIVLLADDEE